jgi:hypothetical protein
MDIQELKRELVRALDRNEISLEEITQIKNRSSITLLAEILHTILCDKVHIEDTSYTANAAMDSRLGCAFYGENQFPDPWIATCHLRWLEVAKYIHKGSEQSITEILEDVRTIVATHLVQETWIKSFYAAYKYADKMTPHIAKVIRILNPMLVQISDKEEE